MNLHFLLSAALAFLSVTAHAAHGLSLGQPLQYAADFQAFRYVNPNAPKGGTFTLPAAGSFDTLNPFTLKGDHEVGITMLTLDTLLEKSWDEPFAMYGLLAQDVRVAADGLSVTFTLNPKATFHNGDPVLAKDVAASFRTLTADPAAAPMYKFYWGDVSKVETPSPRTVVFRFKQRNSELPLILGELPVFSHKSYPQDLAAAANTLPIGSGPYRFAKAESGRLSEYRRDPHYWAQNLPTRKGRYNFDTVRFRYYKDDSVRIEGIKGGRYDFMQENVARNWERAYPDSALHKRHLSKHEWAHRNTAGMQGFVMNTRKPPFDNILVRRAMVESFDFETVNSRLFYGSYRRSNSFFTNSTLAAAGKPQGAELALLNTLKPQLPPQVFDEKVPEPPQTNPASGVRPNLLKARALLEQAGYRYHQGILKDKNGKPLTFEFLSPSKTYERVTAKWQRDLAKLGIKMTVRIADPAVYQKRMNGFDFDMTITVYANSNSPGNEQAVYFGCEAAKTDGSRNWAGVCNPAVEKLLKRFEHFNSRAELETAARALDRVIRHQYIIVPNWYADTFRVVYRDNLGIPARMPLYYYPTEWALSSGWRKARP
ncbi:extracellular solute-binding protein [Neisseria animalis]|uniref:ABC transporter substrate-binding protein n=1 Tax=Neisseria animalis TaxID=492 RepID=A0A5P3MQD0_NEIAN|nr:extracellular solute-binding protein [Neisseria animalis]QEY23640.1 ABC transporter substrate-binding protein [Neisseria animalis]ROW32785.1 ABC transporter substrate-binding protein [Neisseria animalis]